MQLRYPSNSQFDKKFFAPHNYILWLRALCFFLGSNSKLEHLDPKNNLTPSYPLAPLFSLTLGLGYESLSLNIMILLFFLVVKISISLFDTKLVAPHGLTTTSFGEEHFVSSLALMVNSNTLILLHQMFHIQNFLRRLRLCFSHLAP